MLELTAVQLETVRALLAKRLPDVDVLAFGSRVTGSARAHSDLDLAVVADAPVPALALAELRADLEESDLPFRVDVVEWHDLPGSLRDAIAGCSVRIQRVASRP